MTVRKGIALFLGLTAAVSAAVLFATVDRTTLHLLLGAKKEGLLLALGVVIVAWSCDTLRFCCFAKAAGERVPLKLGLSLTWLNYFGSAITPMQGGGGPFQMYVLYKRGIPIGKCVAITLTRTLITLFLLGFFAPLALIFRPEFFKGRIFIKGIFTWVLFFVICSWVLVICSILYPKVIKRLGSWVTLVLNRLGFLKKRYNLSIVRRIYKEIDNYRENFRLFFSGGLPHFILGVVFSCLHLLCLFSVLPCLIWAVGLPVHYFEALMVQALFMFVLYFVPTPGASGVAEGGGAAIFKLLVPLNLAGVMAISWRFYTEYLAIFMGGIVAVKFLGWGITEKILNESRQEKEETNEENAEAQ